MIKRKGAPKFRTQAIPPKFGFCLIDFQFEAEDRRVKSMDGTLGAGLEAVCRLLKFLREKEIPICVVEITTIDTPTNSRVLDIVGRDAKIIRKTSLSAFEYSGLEEHLNRAKVNTLVIGGFNAAICVKKTTLDAIIKGYEVWTTKEILFTDNLVRADPSRVQQIVTEQLEFYRDQTSHFETVDGLRETIQRQLR